MLDEDGDPKSMMIQKMNKTQSRNVTLAETRNRPGKLLSEKLVVNCTWVTNVSSGVNEILNSDWIKFKRHSTNRKCRKHTCPAARDDEKIFAWVITAAY